MERQQPTLGAVLSDLTVLRAGLILLLVGTAAVSAAGFTSGMPAWGIAGIIGFLIVCAVGGYTDGWAWTGIGPSVRGVGGNVQTQEGKTLWDVLQLLFLPAVLTFGVVWFNSQQTAADKKKAEVQAQDTVMSDYISEISDLMLKDKLGSAHPRDGASAIARARTLTTLPQLDSSGRSNVVRFLIESNLIRYVGLSVVNLQGVELQGFNFSCDGPPQGRPYCADLRYAWLDQNVDLSFTDLAYADLASAHLDGTNLSHANLYCGHLPSEFTFKCHPGRADLAHANLSRADLSYAKLSHADLSYAKLSHADLSHTNLSGADLSHARLTGVHWDHTKCPDSTNSSTNHTSPQSCIGHL